MGQTYRNLPYPEPTDPVAQGAAAIRALAEKVDSTFPNAAARDAAIPAPKLGMTCTLTDTGEIYRYRLNEAGVGVWWPINQAVTYYGRNRTAGGQIANATLQAIAATGSAFPKAMVGLTDETAGTGATIGWWSALTRIQFMTAAHDAHVYLEAAGYVTAALTADAYPAVFADLVHDETDTDGEPVQTVDLAELVHRLIERLAAVESRLAED